MTLDRSHAIRVIVEKLKETGINLSEMSALDFFARSGEWQTSYYAPLVKKLQAWEIDPRFESDLQKNLPSTSTIVIGDSFKLAKRTKEKFDLIVLDNPMGCYGEGYCEHFEAIECALDLLSDIGTIIFNVKTVPFNYENKEEWRKRRDQFYGTKADDLSKEFVLDFYIDFLTKRNFKVLDIFLTLRPQESGLLSLTANIARV